MELCPILCNLVPRASYRFEGDQRSMFEFILVVNGFEFVCVVDQ